MLHSFLQIRLSIVFVLAGSFLSGCVTTDTPTTRFYVLNPLDSGVSILSNADQNDSLSVEVASLRLPQYLERPQIVTRSSRNQLQLAEFHQWGGNLRKNMMRVLAKNLSQLLGTTHIAISPHRPPTPSDFLVELEVMQFERDSDGKVRLSAQWRLTRGKDQKPLAIQITNLTSPAIPTDRDFEQTVSDMSSLMGELSQIIGREILKNVNGGT
tara:strand:+ start:4674 stop:5309 length:636 start_codon:yes stop_codon:yes gene_type:complete